MEKPWKVIFAFVCVFVAGAVFGGVFTLRSAGGNKTAAFQPPHNRAPQPGSRPPPAPPPVQIQPAIMRQMTQRLNLTGEQREKIKPVVARATEELLRLRRENLHETTRVMEVMYADVAASLTPEQRSELEEMKRKMQERVAEERKKRGDPPGGEGGRKPDPRPKAPRPPSE